MFEIKTTYGDQYITFYMTPSHKISRSLEAEKLDAKMFISPCILSLEMPRDFSSAILNDALKSPTGIQ